ncbi:hypothetical protein HYQ46_003660 [Verticillium longisporum]|nr:hypothetical protein HYQ46_003660 [Verticillium longisporum]
MMGPKDKTGSSDQCGVNSSPSVSFVPGSLAAKQALRTVASGSSAGTAFCSCARLSIESRSRLRSSSSFVLNI